MLTTLIVIVHVIVCIALILIILLQTGKGADIGATFGGGSSQTVFGSTGATPFLSKVTIGAAVIFMVTSTFLTYFAGKTTAVVERSIMSDQPVKEAPATPGPAAPQVPAQQSVPESGQSAPAPVEKAPEK
jgi:preprotein translocase subunit SecG